MKNRKYFYPGLAAIFCALIAVLGWVYLVYSSPGTTVIGEDISTRNATTTGNLVVQGNTTLATTTITNLTATAASSTNLTVSSNATSTNLSVTNIFKSGSAPFYIDSSGNASTTGNLIVGGTTNLATTTITDLTATTASSTNLTISSNATSSNLSVTGIFKSGSSAQFYIDSSGNASTTGNLIVGGTTTLGGGTAITKLLFGTVSITFGEVATTTTVLATTTLTGATADMKCVLQPPFNLADDLVPKGCTTTAGVIGAYLYNVTGPGVTPGATTWGYLLIK